MRFSWARILLERGRLARTRRTARPAGTRGGKQEVRTLLSSSFELRTSWSFRSGGTPDRCGRDARTPQEIGRDPPASVAEREVASAIGPRKARPFARSTVVWVRGGRVAEGSRSVT